MNRSSPPVPDFVAPGGDIVANTTLTLGAAATVWSSVGTLPPDAGVSIRCPSRLHPYPHDMANYNFSLKPQIASNLYFVERDIPWTCLTSLNSNPECKKITTDSLGSGDQGLACSSGTASYYGNGGWPPCDPCPQNTYAPAAGTAVCLACRNFTFTTTTGSTACTACPSSPAAVQAMLQLRNVPACEACGLCCSSKVIYFLIQCFLSSFILVSPYISCTCQ